MNLSQQQVIHNGNKTQGSYTVIVQKPIQLIPASQMYSHPSQIQNYQKVSFIQTETQHESAKKMQQLTEQMKSMQKSSIQISTEQQNQSHQMKRSLIPLPSQQNIQSVQITETTNAFFEEKQRWLEKETIYKRQIDELMMNNKNITELLKLKEQENQELEIRLREEEDKNIQSLQKIGKTMQMERMKIIERNTQEQSEFMEQIRKKQVEEYEEILEENRKLQLQMNKIIREKEGLAGRLEIARQEANEYYELKQQISETESKLKERELDIFRYKQQISQHEIKIEELLSVNRKLSEGASLQLGQTNELGRRMQLAEEKEREAVEMRTRAEKQIQECSTRMNSQQEYLNQVLGQLANAQKDNQEMEQQIQALEEEYNNLQEEYRKQQMNTMEISGQLKQSENARLFIEDKLSKQERLIHILKSRENELQENEELVHRLEEVNEIVRSKEWEISKLIKKLESTGEHLQEVSSVAKEKEQEIFKVLKQNKQITQAKKKYKEKVKQLEIEILEVAQKDKGENEEKIRKLYEDNQTLFKENKELKRIISEGQTTLKTNVEENHQLKQQIEQIVQKYESLREQEHTSMTQQFHSEKLQIQRLQSQFKMNEEQYTQRIHALESTLAKMRNDTLLSKNYGNYSFDKLFKDFNAIQQHNQFLVDQLRQYECRFENLGIVQEKVHQGECKICQNQGLHKRVLMANQMNNEIRMKENTRNIKTASDGFNKLNNQIYNRCQEITKKYA